jgi:SAM-dependent methyltransferase
VTAAVGYDAALYEQVAALEPQSFWFRARNRLIVSMLRRHFGSARSILEVGCGTGYVLAALRRAYPDARIVGSELLEEGLSYARMRVPDVELVTLDIADVPYSDVFDVVAAFDVLEHIDDDVGALAGMFRAARSGGGSIILVPQHRRLWSKTDELAHHVRRYERRELLEKVESAGFRIVAASSFVTLLLPVLAAARAFGRVRPPTSPFEGLAPRYLNGLFERTLDLERKLIERGVSLPAGGSLLVVARKG